MVVDARDRRRWADVARTWKLETRQPAVWETANVIDDNSEAALVVAEGLLEGPGGKAPAGSDEAIRGVVLDGLEGRPGSAHALSLLGRAAASGDPVTRWARPLQLATAAAPGLDFASGELGRRYLATWASLSPEEQKSAEAALRQALRDTAFVDTSFPVVVEKLGGERAVALLPDDTLALGLAARFLETKGPPEAHARAVARLKALPTEKASRTGP